MANVFESQDETSILDADAITIAAMIKNEVLSCEACVEVFIQHIKHVNAGINAVVETRFQEARQEAKEKDQLIKDNEVIFSEQPLFGVPISVKESINVSGMKTTGGLHNRSDLMMADSAVSVKKLIEAGAIILGKTNTPPLCFCHETDNKLYGKTNNAWNPSLSAGGSSGGEASLIATGASSLGLASDIGGSIRLPSHFNGVVGFKPGKFQVNTEGHFPSDTIPLKARMSSIGPIGKSVRDAELLYKIISKPKRKKVLYEKMQIEILPSDNGFPLSEDTADVLAEIKHFLNEHYLTKSSIPPYFSDSAVVWQELMSVDGGIELKKLAFNTDRPNVWQYYLKEKMTRKTNTHLYLSWALIGANLFKPTKKRIKEIDFFLKEGDHVLENYLNNRLLIMPVYHTVAQPHGQTYNEIFSIKKTYQKYMPYLAYANVWGLPSLTIPFSRIGKQMPIGIQIMGKNGNEDAIFKAGKLLESHFGGFKRSKFYDKSRY